MRIENIYRIFLKRKFGNLAGKKIDEKFLSKMEKYIGTGIKLLLQPRAFLLIFASLQLFLSLVYLPASIEIFSNSITIKNERSIVEEAAKDFDAVSQFNALKSNSSIDLEDYRQPIPGQELLFDIQKFKYQRAISQFAQTLRKSTPCYISGSLAGRVHPLKKDDSGAISEQVVYLVPSSGQFSLANLNSGRFSSARFVPKKYNILKPSSIESWNFALEIEQQTSSLFTEHLARSDFLATCIWFQAFFALLYLIICAKTKQISRLGALFCVLGAVSFSIGWIVGIYRSSFYDNIFSFWFANSGGSSTEIPRIYYIFNLFLWLFNISISFNSK
jgi:hypothetical protein